MKQIHGKQPAVHETTKKSGRTMSNTAKKEKNLFEKFKHFMKDAKQKQLINKLHSYHGKNFPILYKKEYNFSQKWQQSLNSDSNDQGLLEDNHPIHSIIFLITVLLNSYTIWALSFERYFGSYISSSSIHLYEIMIGLKSTQVFIKGLTKYNNSETKSFKLKVIFRLIYREFISLCYFIYLSIQGRNSSNFFEIIVQLLVIYVLWKESVQIYQKFKVNGQIINYQNQLKIFDLLINIFVQAHIFAIFLYSASKINPDSSWTNAIGVNTKSIVVQYIYSFYFACTTMLTIGYGDITPKNEAQVMVVVVVQIVGVLSFGYLLNEMGHTLSAYRKKEQQLQKDLQTVSKMSKFYNLEKKLQHKAKVFLLANQANTNYLKPNDQNCLLMKLNQELRNQITHENYLSIVKSSIFFLCNWSKAMQVEVAKRLQKKLVSPNEKLDESSRPQRIFIIKKGKIEIFMNKFGSSANQKKLLRSIKVNPLLPVADNLYGYTIAFSNRPVYLEAVASQFTSTYSITKEQFLENFQYFHELKCRIDQSQFSEQWEAPSIKSSRQHYIPSHIFLIIKYKKKLNAQLNQRKFVAFLRKNRKKFGLINQFRRKLDSKRLGTASLLSVKTLEFQLAEMKVFQPMQDQIREEQYSYSSEQSQLNSKSFEKSSELAMEHARIYIKAMNAGITLQQTDQEKKKVYSQFEKQKSFKNFFAKNNLDEVLLKLTKENCLQRRFNK